MLSPPHSEGGVGALRLERARNDAFGARVTLVVGIAELIGTATAEMARVLSSRCSTGEWKSGLAW